MALKPDQLAEKARQIAEQFGVSSAAANALARNTDNTQGTSEATRRAQRVDVKATDTGELPKPAPMSSGLGWPS